MPKKLKGLHCQKGEEKKNDFRTRKIKSKNKTMCCDSRRSLKEYTETRSFWAYSANSHVAK